MYRRKPLNNIEQPQWADIKKGPPRFVKSKRYSPVDVGRTIMDADKFPETWGHQVLTNSKDITQKYGRRPHHTMVVDKEFRSPPEALEDIMPISRTRRPTVFGRINPSGGYFKAQNTSANEVDGYLKFDQTAKVGSLAPTYESPITFFEPTRQPVLARKLPSTSVTAGRRATQGKEVINRASSIPISEKMVPIPVNAGFEYPFGAGGPFEVADVELQRKHPALSVDAGSGTLQVFTPQELPIYEYTLPYTSERGQAGQAAKNLTFEVQNRRTEKRGVEPQWTSTGFQTSYEAPIDDDLLGIKSPKNLNPRSEVNSEYRSGYGKFSEQNSNRSDQVIKLKDVPDIGFYQVPPSSSNTQRAPSRGATRVQRKARVGTEKSSPQNFNGGQKPRRGFSYDEGLRQSDRYHYKPEAMW